MLVSAPGQAIWKDATRGLSPGNPRRTPDRLRWGTRQTCRMKSTLRVIGVTSRTSSARESAAPVGGHHDLPTGRHEWLPTGGQQ